MYKKFVDQIRHINTATPHILHQKRHAYRPTTFKIQTTIPPHPFPSPPFPLPHNSQAHPSPNAPPHKPDPLPPQPNPNPDVRPGIQPQTAPERLLDGLVPDATQVPVDRQPGARARAGGHLEGHVVQDRADGFGAVVVGRGVQVRDCDGGVREGGEQGEGCGGGDEMEGGVVDEFGGVGVAVVVVFVVRVAVWVLGWGEFGGWDVDGEGGEGLAEIGLVRDRAGVGGEG